MAERRNASRAANAESSRPRIDEWRVAYAALIVAAAALFAFKVNSILSPLLVYALLIALIAPYTGTRRHFFVVIGSTSLLVIWLLTTLGSLLAPFLLALVIAYLLDPAVDFLERRRLPRALAIAVLGIPALGLFAVVVTLGIPELVDQIEALISRLPDAMQRLSETLTRLRERLGNLRIPFLPEFDPTRDITLLNPDRLREYLAQRQATILQGGAAALLGVGRGVAAVLTILGYVVLTPILLVYLLLDFDRITAQAASLIPPPRRERMLGFFRDYDRLLSRFVRGQLINATVIGMLTWLGLWILRFPYSGLVGVVAGVFNLVPYLGMVVSLIPVVIISLLSGNILISLGKAAIVFVAVQLLEQSVTGPKIVGSSVGLHPVWVMLALTVGGFALGFVGLLLAMPAAVLIKLLVAEGMKQYRGSRVFRSGEAAPSGET
jgi:predicted PurR-regulated permease PerM